MTMKCLGEDKEAWEEWEESEEVLVEEEEVVWTWDLWWTESSTVVQDLTQCIGTENSTETKEDLCLQEAMMTSSLDLNEEMVEVEEEEVDHLKCTIEEWDTTSDLKEDMMTTMRNNNTTTTMVVQCILQEADIMREDTTQEKVECLQVEAQGSDLNLTADKVSQICVVEGHQWEADVMTILVTTPIIEEEEVEVVAEEEAEMMVLLATDLKEVLQWEVGQDLLEEEVDRMTEMTNPQSYIEEPVEEAVIQTEEEIEVVTEAIAIESTQTLSLMHEKWPYKTWWWKFYLTRKFPEIYIRILRAIVIFYRFD